MAGRQKSVYLEDEDLERIGAYAQKYARSFSWALRELSRLGLRHAQLATVEDYQELYHSEPAHG